MLAECNLNPRVVSNLKAGQMPSADKIVGIAQYLEISTDYLMGATDYPPLPKKELTREEKLVAKIYRLTPESYNQIENFVEFLSSQNAGYNDQKEETIRVFRAAKSEGEKPPELIDIPVSKIEKLKNAPSVTNDNDI